MLDKVIEVSRIAGEVVKEGFDKNFEVEYKANETDLVTDIDKESERSIIDYIKKNFPDHSILSEESGEERNSSEYTWVIDPIDGTTNFAHGLPLFSVSIAVMKDSEVIAGAVNHVMDDTLYTAEKGGGAYANDKKLKVSDKDQLIRSLLVTGFPYDLVTGYDDILSKFSVMLRESRAVRRLGSAALDLCYVAQGAFEGFWEVNLNPWDIAAGILLVEEAGGKVTNYKGEPHHLNAKQLLATNGKIHDEMIKLLK